MDARGRKEKLNFTLEEWNATNTAFNLIEVTTNDVDADKIHQEVVPVKHEMHIDAVAYRWMKRLQRKAAQLERG